MRSSDRIWLATGTPMPNHPGELFPHCFHLWPEHMQYAGHTMEYWEFEAAFCQIQLTNYGMMVVGGRNLKELKARLAPVVSVIKRKEVLDLPPLIIDTWALSVPGVIRTPKIEVPGLLGTLARYGTLSDVDRFDKATLEIYLACIESALLPLPSIRREIAQLKAIYTSYMIAEEIDEDGKKIVVFAHHREALATLAKALTRFNPAVIHGDVPQGRRQAEIDRFQTDPECKVFIGQITAAGASINLQAASKVIFVEMSWVPGENEQAYARVYRMGQDKSVWVRFVYLPDSVDEAVSRALARKVVMIEGVFGKQEHVA
jgi:SWI/SNF-related matrix-associated actin-dependent regulator of chromatin subfamily A-like protein 1